MQNVKKKETKKLFALSFNILLLFVERNKNNNMCVCAWLESAYPTFATAFLAYLGCYLIGRKSRASCNSNSYKQYKYTYNTYIFTFENPSTHCHFCAPLHRRLVHFSAPICLFDLCAYAGRLEVAARLECDQFHLISISCLVLLLSSLLHFLTFLLFALYD